jgi:hypothetical protein
MNRCARADGNRRADDRPPYRQVTGREYAACEQHSQHRRAIHLPRKSWSPGGGHGSRCRGVAGV